MSALTDSTNSVSYDPVNRPGVSNLLQLLAHFDAEGRSAEELGRVHGGTGMGLKAFKTLVAETIGGKLESIRTTFERVMREGNGGYLDEVEKRGGERARESAEATMSVVREAVGL
jgi:tryptophanyl-tRNA synthetase